MQLFFRKRGYYFLLDAVLGVLIMVTAFSFIFSKPVITPTKSRLEILSNDILTFLSDNKIEDINDPYAGVNGILWNDGKITNQKNTLLEQIGEFYYKEDYETANRFIETVTRMITPSQFNLEIVVDNMILYPFVGQQQNLQKEKSSVIVVTKTLVLGIDSEKHSAWGPYKVEVVMWE